MKDYKNIFEQIKKFKKEQNRQKQRGLNNYNILTTVLKEHDEVRLHSRMIASLLDPSGEHYQSNLFLDKFLEVLNVPEFQIDSEKCSVYREYENIDLYITDSNKHIIMENKIYARDPKEQIKRYIEKIEKKNSNLKFNDILVIYLSLDRDEPSEYSLGNLSIKDNLIQRDSESIALFKSIHYKTEILEWLKISQYEIQNITNLNEVFRQYIDVVKMINNQYKDKIMSLSDYIKDNKEVYELAIELTEELPNAREEIVNEFFNKITVLLKEKLSSEWKVEIVGDLNTKYDFPFRIYKESWIGSKENNLIFGFEFNQNNYYDGYFGIVRKNNKVDIENDIINVFKTKIPLYNELQRDDDNWLHWKWLPNIDETVDFAKYIQLDKDAEEEFIKEIMKIIKIFELDSNLITEINSYLNSQESK
jgi:hypothetical protein